jgi:CheY-like chemotaxis protein
LEEDKHILVVDDNTITTLIFGKIIQALQFKFTPAYNGLKAIEKCYENKFDLIFLDIHLPIMNGFTTLSKIRAINLWYSQIPIIGTTAEITSNNFYEPNKNLFDDFLYKPIQYEKIEALLLKYLNITQKTHEEKIALSTIESVINWNYINDLSKNDTNFINQLLTIFLNEGRLKIELMQAQLLQGNWRALQKQAHQSKQLFAILNDSSILSRLQQIQETENFSEFYLLIEQDLFYISDLFVKASQEINKYIYQQSLKGNV